MASQHRDARVLGSFALFRSRVHEVRGSRARAPPAHIRAHAHTHMPGPAPLRLPLHFSFLLHILSPVLTVSLPRASPVFLPPPPLPRVMSLLLSRVVSLSAPSCDVHEQDSLDENRQLFQNAIDAGKLQPQRLLPAPCSCRPRTLTKNFSPPPPPFAHGNAHTSDTSNAPNLAGEPSLRGPIAVRQARRPPPRTVDGSWMTAAGCARRSGCFVELNDEDAVHTAV